MTSEALHTRVDWQQWLRLFELPATSAALPLRTNCPICRADGTLTIFDDSLSGGQWVWCRSCRHAGDLIRTTGSVWNCEPLATVRRLTRAGFQIAADNETIERYVHAYHKPLRTSRRLWRAAQARLPKSSTLLKHKIHQLGCPTPTDDADFTQRFGELFGSVDCLETEHKLRTRSKTRKARKLFPGTDWQDALAIPRWNLPGRLAGFSFAKGWSASRDFASHYFGKDAGLALHPSLLSPRRRDDRRVLATRNLRTYLQMQCRRMVLEGNPLPMVHWTASEHHTTAAAWQMLRGLDVVLWESTITAAVLATAYELNCRITTTKPQLADVKGDVGLAHDQLPDEVFESVLRDAKPWYDVLSALVRQLDDDAVKTLFNELMVRRVDVPQMLLRCPDAAQYRVRMLLSTALERRTLAINRQLLVERDGGWYCRERHGQSELICDAILRIDRVIHRARRQETVFQGRVLYREHEVPFHVEKDDIEKRPFAWMQELLMQKGLGVMQYNPTWRQHVINAATQLSPPVFVRGVDHVGWDAERQSLVLPEYELPYGGEPRPHTGGFAADVPGRSLIATGEISPADIEDIGESNTRTAMLTATAVAAAVVLAPMLGRVPPNILLKGNAAHAALRVLCQGVDTPLHRPKTPKECDRAANQRDGVWLRGIDGTFLKPATYRRWLNQHEDGGIATVVDDAATASAMLLTGRWYTLATDRIEQLQPPAAAAISRILAKYLTDSVKEQRTFIGDDWGSDLIADFQEWLARTGVREPLLGLLPLRRPTAAGTQLRTFFTLLRQLRAVDLVKVDAPAKIRIERCTCRKTAAIAIPKQAFLATVSSALHVTLTQERVSLILSSVLLDDEEDAWLVPEAKLMAVKEESSQAEAL